MTDPADRHSAESHLEGRLHALAGGVRPPVVATDDDVRRGRRRLLRMRVALAGATTGTLAVVLGVTGLTAGDPAATEAPFVDETTTSPPATPDSAPVDDETDPPASEPAGEDQVQAQGKNQPGGEPDGAGTASTAVGDTKGRDGAVGGTQVDPGSGPAHDSSFGPAGDQPGTPTGEPGADPSADPTGTPSGTPTPTETPTDQPTSTPPTTPPVEPPPTEPPPPPPPTVGPVKVHKVLGYFNDVLAEQLDPEREHLQAYDRTVDPRTVTRIDDELFALGSSYRWEGGADDTAALKVRVATGWDQVAWQCGATPSAWSCRSVPDTDAELATHDGLREVAVEHADGQVVVVATDLPGRALSDLELADAALDDRLVVPGDAPVAPAGLDVGPFGAAGEAALVREGEGFTTTAYARQPLVRGTWSVEGVDRGTIGWSATPLYSGGAWECLTTYRSCTDVEVADGTIVHVGLLKKKAGWIVQYDGPAYAVRVTSSDPGLPKKRAYPFVVDPDWQPAG